MALWQFECEIIPASIKEMVPRPWSAVSPPAEPIRFLPLTETQPGRFRQYGDVDSTCIVLWYNGDTLTDISCRLDLRTLSKPVLEALVNYARTIHGDFLINEKRYSSSLDVILPLIKGSEANRFYKDPAAYFDSIRGGSFR